MIPIVQILQSVLMPPVRALIYILLPITCKPDYIDIVYDTLCSWFWFCLTLDCTFAILIIGIDLKIVFDYPFAFFSGFIYIIWFSGFRLICLE